MTLSVVVSRIPAAVDVNTGTAFHPSDILRITNNNSPKPVAAAAPNGIELVPTGSSVPAVEGDVEAKGSAPAGFVAFTSLVCSV